MKIGGRSWFPPTRRKSAPAGSRNWISARNPSSPPASSSRPPRNSSPCRASCRRGREAKGVIARLERATSIPETAYDGSQLLRLHPCQSHRRNALHRRDQRPHSARGRASPETGGKLYEEK